MNSTRLAHTRWGTGLVLSAALALLLVQAAPLRAQETSADDTGAAAPLEVLDLVQQDLDNDGQPDVTILAARYATELDRVAIYDGGSDMWRGERWQDVADFRNDTWLFDTGADNDADLIIRFLKNGDGLRADIYYDVNQDGQLEVTRSGTALVINETRYPPISVFTETDWYLPDGRVNWNVTFQTDGRWFDNGLWDQLYQSIKVLKLDGIPDARLQFVDANTDGIPEYGVGTVLTDFPFDFSVPRAMAYENIIGTIPRQPQAALFWPFLASGTESTRGMHPREIPDYDLVRVRYFDVVPRIGMDWWNTRRPGVYIPGYPIEEGFHLNGNRGMVPDQINYMNFELIQAYYDLARDRDHNPELHIRHRYFERHDPGAWDLPADLNEIRWSWNQTNAPGLVWDYKIGLAGRQTITDVTTVGEYAYYAVPWEEIPEWVMNQSWDIATFISIEGEPFLSSEGVYDWGPVERAFEQDPTILSRYLSGQLVINHLANVFTDISVGMRGEFADYINDAPYLYFSPLDAELHLVGAQGCLYQVSETDQIKCFNDDGDDYLDRWQYSREGTLVREMARLENFILYSGEDGFAIRRAEDYPQEVFRTLPPANHQEWQTLGRRLEEHAATFEPGDYRAMLERIPGDLLEVHNGTLSHFRSMDNGFSFNMSLREDYQVVAGAPFLTVAGLPAGDYRVEYVNGAFTMRLITPAQLSASVEIRQKEPEVFFTDVRLEVDLTIANHGLTDATDYTLEVFAIPDGGTSRDRVWLTVETVTVFADDSVTYHYEWTPARAGTWRVYAYITQRDVDEVIQQLLSGEEAVPSEWLIEVSDGYELASVQPVDRLQFLTLDGAVPLGGLPVILLWLAIGISGLSLFGLIISHIVDSHDDPTSERDSQTE